MIEMKRILFLRDVHQILWKLKVFDMRLFVEPKAQEVVPFLIAESISPGAKELLKEERVGYFDSGGSFSYLPTVFISVSINRHPSQCQNSYVLCF